MCDRTTHIPDLLIGVCLVQEVTGHRVQKQVLNQRLCCLMCICGNGGGLLRVSRVHAKGVMRAPCLSTDFFARNTTQRARRIDDIAHTAIFESGRRDSRFAALIPFVHSFTAGQASWPLLDGSSYASSRARDVFQTEGKEQPARCCNAGVVCNAHPSSACCCAGQTAGR